MASYHYKNKHKNRLNILGLRQLKNCSPLHFEKFKKFSDKQ